MAPPPGGPLPAPDVDYKFKTGTLTFKPSLATSFTPIGKSIAVPVFGGPNAEADENLTVTLSNPTGGYTLGAGTGTGDCGATPGCATGVILNDDGVTSGLTLGVGDASIVSATSGKQVIKFPVTLSDKALTDVTVDVVVSPGTATYSKKVTDGGDYGGVIVKTLTFKAGATVKQVALPIWPDLLAEPDQSFTVTLSNVNGNGTVVTLIRPVGAGTILGLT